MAVEECIALRSLTLVLQMPLMGRPKMDASALAVALIEIKYAEEFRASATGDLPKNAEPNEGNVHATVGQSKWGESL